MPAAMSRRFALPGLVFGLAVLGGWSAVAAPVASEVSRGLLAHRGIYELKLGARKSDADVSGVDGKLVYEFNGSVCDGFSTQFRFVTRMVSESGRQRLSDMRTSSFEDGQGTGFDFVNQTYIGSALAEDSKGSAKRTDQAIDVTVTKPKADKVKVANDALFPTQHLARLIEAAKAGDSIIEIKLYDGTDGGARVYMTTSVIGKELPRDELIADETAANVPELQVVRRWPVTISYFDQVKKGDGGEMTPEYKLAFVLYENGVSRRMTLDYGDFVLEGRLVDFKPLPQSPCP